MKNGPSARKFPGISMLPNSSDSTRIAIMFGGKEAGDQVIKVKEFDNIKDTVLMTIKTVKERDRREIEEAEREEVL